MSSPPPGADYEAIVIGGGVAGLYQIKRLTDLGISATVLDANADLGGTWFNNRYPGCRFDSESYSYGYSWSQDVLDEWHWTERFSPQPETLRYLSFVADKFDLRRHMQFGCHIESMRFDDQTDLWTLELHDGRTFVCRVVLLCVGCLSIPTYPRLDGIEDFEGPSFHPFDWPHDPLELAGKRVAVVGTGATAVQIIPEVAKVAAQLTVFQRRPNWAAPLNNSPISAAEMADIRTRYDEIFATCASTPGAFVHVPNRTGFWNSTREQRLELWDRLYDGPGFGIWLANFAEIMMDEAANAEFSEYIAERIRRRVHDPVTAERLIPKDHGFGVQRVPLETEYFEAYNRDNVVLIDATETPIERVTPTGIRTSEADFDFDVIVYATGFDAFTGAYDQIDIAGAGGQKLQDKWADGPVTYLGVLVHGFPNLLMVPGPQSSLTNFPRGIETAVNWATPLIEHVREHGHTRFEATAAAEQGWFQEVVDWYQPFLLRKARHWSTGYNSNIDGREPGKVRYNLYNGGGPRWVARLQGVADAGYEGIDFAQIGDGAS